MAVISSILAGISAIGTYFSTLGATIAAGWSAGGISGVLGASTGIGGGIATSGGIAGTFVGGLTVGGALAGVGLAASAITGLSSMYSSARASAKAQAAQAEAIQKLTEESTGTLDVSKTTSSLQDNSRASRTLSSLRVSLLPQATNKEQITNNVYGVDTNNVVSQTQNMTGLNIATA